MINGKMIHLKPFVIFKYHFIIGVRAYFMQENSIIIRKTFSECNSTPLYSSSVFTALRYASVVSAAVLCLLDVGVLSKRIDRSIELLFWHDGSFP